MSGSGTVTDLLLDPRRNLIINGDFRIDQRNASTSSAKFTDSNGFTGYVFDRWHLTDNHTTNTITAWRELFSLGNSLSKSKYFLRYENAAPVGATTLRWAQRIEGVTRISGQRLGVAFLVAGGAPYNINVSFRQHFGTGGSPSSDVLVASQTVAITTTMGRKELQFDVPSVVGKILGTGNNDFLELRFDLPLNTALTFDLGDVVTTLDLPLPFLLAGLDEEDELRKMQRYFSKTFNTGVKAAQASGTFSGAVSSHIAAGGNNVNGFWKYPATMRAVPIISTYNPTQANANWRDYSNTTNYTATAPSANVGDSSTEIGTTGATVTAGTTIAIHLAAEAEL